MATNAEGTAAIERETVSSAPEVCQKVSKASRKIAHAEKETASKRSARVSWRKLSSQKITATAMKIIAEGMNSGKTCKLLMAFAAAHNPSPAAAIAAGVIQGLRCAYSCAPRKKKMPATAYSQSLMEVCNGPGGTHWEIDGPRKCAA